MLSFAVKLLKAPSLDHLSGWEVFDLMVNCRHVAGDYWVMEGDEDSLMCGDRVRVMAEGITEGHGDMNNGQFVEHCEEIFDVSFSFANEPESWRMLTKAKRWI